MLGVCTKPTFHQINYPTTFACKDYAKDVEDYLVATNVYCSSYTRVTFPFIKGFCIYQFFIIVKFITSNEVMEIFVSFTGNNKGFLNISLGLQAAYRFYLLNMPIFISHMSQIWESFVKVYNQRYFSSFSVEILFKNLYLGVAVALLMWDMGSVVITNRQLVSSVAFGSFFLDRSCCSKFYPSANLDYMQYCSTQGGSILICYVDIAYQLVWYKVQCGVDYEFVKLITCRVKEVKISF